jgi:effector-binding domain-containing protein
MNRNRNSSIHPDPRIGDMMTQYEIVPYEPRPYAAIAVTVPMTALGDVVPPLNGEVFAWLAQRGVTPAGAPFWKYDLIDMPGTLRIEAGVALAEQAESDGRVLVSALPAGSYLETTYHGHPDGLVQATSDLLAYAEKERLTFDSSMTPDGEEWVARLEYYLTDPADEPDLNQWDTLLSFKLAD